MLSLVPVDSDFECGAFATLTTTLWISGKEFKDAGFEMDTEQGPCLPNFLIHARRKGGERTLVVEVMGFDRPDYLAGKEVTYERMESLWDRSTVIRYASLIVQPGQRWVLTLGTRTPRAWCFLDRRQS